MKSFSQFNIQVPDKGFEGDKIKMSKILNRKIVVHDFKIEESKVFKGKCLYLQISVNNQKYVVFTSGSVLMGMIQGIPKDGFPFTTTIIEDNNRFMFT
jgi:hypothetical protein